MFCKKKWKRWVLCRYVEPDVPTDNQEVQNFSDRQLDIQDGAGRDTGKDREKKKTRERKKNVKC